MNDYTALYKQTVHIQHKIAHISKNLMLVADHIPAPESRKLKRMADRLWKLSTRQVEAPVNVTDRQASLDT
jgi:hypothetical protein